MINSTIEDLDQEVERMVTHYRFMRDESRRSYSECMQQYANMAHGGPGSDIDDLRVNYYKEYPDSFFMCVLSCLGESDLFLQALES